MVFYLFGSKHGSTRPVRPSRRRFQHPFGQAFSIAERPASGPRRRGEDRAAGEALVQGGGQGMWHPMYALRSLSELVASPVTQTLNRQTGAMLKWPVVVLVDDVVQEVDLPRQAGLEGQDDRSSSRRGTTINT